METLDLIRRINSTFLPVCFMEGPNPLHRTSLIAEWTTIQQKTYHLSHCNALARVTMGGGTASAIEPTHFSYAFLSRERRHPPQCLFLQVCE